MPTPPELLEHAIDLHHAGQLQQAEQIYRQILTADPNDAEALQLLGAIAHQCEQYGTAIDLIERSLAINPNNPRAMNNLGEALRATAQIDRSIATFRELLKRFPDYTKAHNNLLLTLHYAAASTPPGLRHEHEQWARQHATAPIASLPDATASEADRVLRIGYVSPDFRRHSVAYFIEPAIEQHDPQRFKVYCYSNATRADEITARLRGSADEWREIAALDDDSAAEMIRGDEIDILVDLSGHMAKNRLLLFARKPAPIQVTYLGYPNGTGLSQIDYRLSDSIADPPGESDDHTVEKIVRLPGCAWCYRPPEMSPEVAEPTLDRPITFASFNKFAKISPAAMTLWAQMLQRVPESRLLIKAKSLADQRSRAIALEMLSAAGVPGDRVTLLGWQSGVEAHLATYGEVDVALDPFPYNGTTTTCEALWMGAAVITLAGSAHAGRVGASLLSAVGLAELVATSSGEYVDLAVALARDAGRRAELRKTLRDRMRGSVLMDAAGFTRNLESAYRQMWHRYVGACAARLPGFRS
jgi:protein O-GlcNAc transferase